MDAHRKFMHPDLVKEHKCPNEKHAHISYDSRRMCLKRQGIQKPMKSSFEIRARKTLAAVELAKEKQLMKLNKCRRTIRKLKRERKVGVLYWRKQAKELQERL